MKEIFIRLDRCMGCKSCEIACAVEHSRSKNLVSSMIEKPVPRKRLYVENPEGIKMPMVCRHCDDAPCVEVCRTGATKKDAISGIVTKDDSRCIGCWMCVMVCPYGMVGRQKEVKKAVKCDLCPDIALPACVTACPTGTLVFAEEEEFAEIMRRDAALQIARGHKTRA
ncbi:MAG: 4Fe-4S dicluster domain-containing protein [Methanotrichaceae archaeon]|nr:4Fe-4S dicluster domain-containing protein [Methanotrichaceae archaeon]